MFIIKNTRKIQPIFIIFLLSIFFASCSLSRQSQYDECDYWYCGSIQIDTYVETFQKSLSLTQEYVVANNGIILESRADRWYITIYFEDWYDKNILTKHKEKIDKIGGVKKTRFRMILSLLENNNDL